MSQKKILIVEDEIIVANNLKAILERVGYSVPAIITSGRKAVARVVDVLPDMILMDINLGGDIDGINVANEIHKKLDVPIIFLTSYSERRVVERAKQVAPYGFILKPFKERELTTVIEMAIHRHELEVKLKKSEERFRTVADFTYDWEYWIGPDQNYIYISPSCERITGYTADEFMKKPDLLEKNVHPDDRDIFSRHNLEELSNRDIHSLDFRFKTRKGDVRWLAHRCQPVYDSDGNFLGRRASNRDITERKNAEEERKRAYTELDQILNTIGTGICLIDKNYNLVRVNNAFFNIFNLFNEEITGPKCYEILNEPFCKSESCPLKKILKGDKFNKFEITRDNRNSEIKTFSVIAAPYYSTDKKIEGIVASYTEITEVRRLEKEIMKISQVERQTIGQDLHDGLGQKLTGVAFLVEALRQTMNEKSYPEISDITEIIKIVDDSIEHTRKIAKGLSPVNLESFGIEAALEELASNTERTFGIICRVEKKGHIYINDNSVAINLYYVTLESINNAVRHGKADKIIIKLNSDKNGLTMRIEDNGRNLSKSSITDPGMGLRIMRYRANIIGADFEAGKNKNGFTVKIKLKKT